MTEAQLKSFAKFRSLPVYDEGDAQANALTFPSGQYRTVRTCTTLQEVEECLRDPRLVPLGGLRAVGKDGPIAVALFGELP